MRDELELAIKFFSDAIEINGTAGQKVKCLAFRSSCNDRLGRTSEALQDALQSIQLDPKHHIRTHERAVKCFIIFGNFDCARKYIEECKAVFPGNEPIIKELSEVLQTIKSLESQLNEKFDEKDYNACLVILNKLLDVAHKSVRFTNLRADCIELDKVAKSLCKEIQDDSEMTETASGLEVVATEDEETLPEVKDTNSEKEIQHFHQMTVHKRKHCEDKKISPFITSIKKLKICCSVENAKDIKTPTPKQPVKSSKKRSCSTSSDESQLDHQPPTKMAKTAGFETNSSATEVTQEKMEITDCCGAVKKKKTFCAKAKKFGSNFFKCNKKAFNYIVNGSDKKC